MKNNRIFFYITLTFSFIPFLSEYYLLSPLEDFAVIDGFTLSFFIFSLLLGLSLYSLIFMVMFSVTLNIIAIIFILINIEYYSMFQVYITYGILPLINDMFRAASNFDLTPLFLLGSLYFSIILGLIFSFKKLHFKVPIATTLFMIFISLSTSFLANSLHAKRYTLIPQATTNGLTALKYGFENSIMAFYRSTPISQYFNPTSNAESETFKSIAYSLENDIPIKLPEKYALSHYKQLIPNYPEFKLTGNPLITFEHEPNSINTVPAPIKKNIILIILESSRAFETGFKNTQNSLTPNLDKIAKEGLITPNFYATNRTTVKSELAILCSRPDTLEGVPFSIYKEKVKMDCLPKILGRHGYNTLWFHGNTKEFFNRDEFLPSLGFDSIYAKEEFIMDGYKQKDIGWGVADTILYDTALKKLSESPNPFFAEILSVSNHFPYNWDFQDTPFPKYLEYVGDDHYKNYRRGVFYADYALGQFWDAFNKSSLKENTILIITADHGVPHYPDNITSETEKYKILFNMPLIIIDKDIKPSIINTQLSHYDLAPTILSLLNINDTVSFIGRPFLGASKTNANRPIYLDNVSNYGFLFGALSCLPTKDLCDTKKQSCQTFEDKLCSSSDTELLKLTSQINPLRQYLSLLREARLP